MWTISVILGIWLLLNVLFVLIVLPPRKQRLRPDAPGTMLAPAPIDPHQDRLHRGKPSSLRHAFVSRVSALFFALVSPLIALRDTIARLWKASRRPRPRR